MGEEIKSTQSIVIEILLSSYRTGMMESSVAALRVEKISGWPQLLRARGVMLMPED